VIFDDDHAVANAGLALAGLLSEKLGLEELCEETIDIAPFPGRWVATPVHALVAGTTALRFFDADSEVTSRGDLFERVHQRTFGDGDAFHAIARSSELGRQYRSPASTHA
jgi:hypothetical protein